MPQRLGQNMKVFISHSPEDKEYARALASMLKEDEFEPWLVEGWIAGADLHVEAAHALASSHAMVVVVSPESMESPWVQSEIQFALGSANYKGRVLPIVLGPVKSMPWILNQLGRIDAQTADPRDDPKVKEALVQLRAEEVAG